MSYIYDYDSIKKLINHNIPIILTLYKANNGYYKYHSVTIRGFIEYENNKDEIIKLLVINDNWSLEPKYINYGTLSSISCISYFI